MTKAKKLRPTDCTNVREDKCHGCGAKILWAEGIKFPLSARLVPCADISQLTDDDGAVHPPRMVQGQSVYVSHFVDCPERDRFSRSRR